MSTNLEIRKTASDLAFETINSNSIQFDAAVTAKAAEQNLTEPEYGKLKADAANFRRGYQQAAALDKQPAPAPASPKILQAPVKLDSAAHNANEVAQTSPQSTAQSPTANAPAPVQAAVQEAPAKSE